MSSIDTAALKRRLRKILALTKSGEAGEAAAALHQAKRLMEVHGLSEKDVLDIQEAQLKLSGTDISSMEGALVNVIRQALGVEVLVCCQPRVKGGGRRGRASVVFIGEGANPQIALYAFSTLRRQIEANLAASLRDLQIEVGREPRDLRLPSRLRQEYARGWCSAVRKKIIELGATGPSPEVQAFAAKRKTCDEVAPVRAARGTGGRFTDTFLALGARDGLRAQIHKGVHVNQKVGRLCL